MLRTAVSPELSFGDLLARVRRVALDAFAHQDYPFSLLTGRLQPVRDPSRSPLFQALFTLYKARKPEQQALAGFALGEAGASLEMGSVSLHSTPLPTRPAQLDLSLSLAETPRGAAGSLVYSADLFDRATAARMASHLRTLLGAALADPSQPVGSLPLLTPEERAEVLTAWNATAAPYPADRLAHELFEMQADRVPDACALEAGAARLTYRELEERANQLAHHLIRLGVGPEVTVGLCCERSPDLVIGLLGVLKAGGSYLPLDPAYPPERLRAMLDDSGTSLMLTQERFDTDRAEIAAQPTSRPLRRSGPDNRAYLIYTSGSTGRPKGVEVHHRALVNFLAAMAREPGLTAGDRLLSVTTLAFDIAGLELYLPLAVGARVILADRETAADGHRLLASLRKSEATAMQATPSTWRLLLAAGWQGEPRLRVLCGGEALPPDLAEHLAARGESAWNLYGPTETTIWSAVHRLPVGGAGPVLAGRPIANTQIYVVDRIDPDMQPAVPGTPGELLIGGDGVTRGYFGRPDLTAERFIPDPFGDRPGGRLYRTGDLARHRNGGDLEILGRLDHQVKIRGFRIELGEIETALAAVPGVRQAVVVARADRSGGRRLIAYLVSTDLDTDLDIQTLRRLLADRLPEAFIPSRFVTLAALPLTPNGKVDRASLPEPDAGRPELGTDYRPPRSELERTIAAVWREVLGVDAVGVHDNFFDLGGHSLLLAQAHSRLAALGHDLALLDLFRHPTIDALARRLSPAADPVSSLTPAPAPPAATGAMAIIGMAGRFPGAPDVDELWRRLCEGDELISRLSEADLEAAGEPAALRGDPDYVKAAGVLDGAELFDAAFFGFSPREAEVMDPQHRVFLECAWQALEDAGYDAARTPERVGVYAAVGINTYLHHLQQAGLPLHSGAARYQAFIANDKDFVPTRVSYKLGLRGPSINVQTACSSSLVAVHLACQALRAGDCEMALVGGVSIRAPQRTGYVYEEGGILSPDGHCRAFAADARGTVFGNGAGAVVLKPLERALADGDHVYAVVKGSAINNDGDRKVGYTAPSVEGQAAVIAAALAAAGVPAASIRYVEAHGTGTPMGDPIEVAALREAFALDPKIDSTSRCALGSVKTNLGHLDTAAGIAGLIKTVQALRHHRLPPSLHCAEPNPRIDFTGGPFYVNTELTDWQEGSTPRRAGVSSFGIGGTNAHVVLEEAPEVAVAAAGPSPPAPLPAPPTLPRERGEKPENVQLLALSAKTATALETATDQLVSRLRETPADQFADLAYTLQVGRHAFAERRIAVCRDPQEAAAALAGRDPERVLSGHSTSGERPVAFLLAGQGTQYVGMGRDLYDAESVFRREIDLCADLLAPHLDFDLRHLLYAETDGAPLDQTALAQPALFAVEYALACLWMEWGVTPQAMLGHSVGEIVAACLAGVMELPEALKLVAARGRLMQALPGGAMLGVALPEAEMAARLAASEDLALAAINGPAACVVSGPAAAVAALAGRLEQEGVRCRPLHVAHAFHSAMMEPALAPFAAAVAKVRLAAPRIPFLSNVTGTWITAAEAQDPAYWVRHLRAPVRFADGVRALLAEPDRLLVEIGPGNALAALVRQQDERRLVAGSLRHPQDQQPDLAFLLRNAGRLWLAGVAVIWPTHPAGQLKRRLALPTYPFERQRYWLEARPTAAGSAAETGAKQSDLADWFSVPSWRQTLPRPARPEARGEGTVWLALLDREGSAVPGRLAERLAALGETVITARPGQGFTQDGERSFTIDPRSAADWDALFAAMKEPPGKILHAWNVGPARPLDEMRMRSFDSLLLLAQALARAAPGTPARIAVLSDAMQKVAGETVLHPEKALLLGLVRVIPQEVEGLSCQSIDVVLPPSPTAEDDLVEDLLAELSGPGDPETGAEAVVAYRGGARFVRGFEIVCLPAEGSPAPAIDGTVLITGGLGGVGLALAEVLAEQPGARLALLGRSPHPRPLSHPLPPPGRGAPPPPQDLDFPLSRAAGGGWERGPGGEGPAGADDRLQVPRERGAQVLAVTADVTDETALAAAIRQVEETLGPIRGVIHAAGVAGGGALQLKTPEEAALVLAPKVLGTILLHRVLRGRDLDFFYLCSSVTALLGGFGQADYCAANAFCDAFAQAHQRRGRHLSAINWDRWEEVGMARAPELEPAHPLLGSRLHATAARDVWTSRLSPERHWVLAEHLIAGQPTVPGTAYLEMARAAVAARLDDGAVELRDVIFPQPLAVPHGESREVRTIVEGSGGDGKELAFRVISRLPEGDLWIEHARGRAAAARPAAPSTPTDLAALRAACNRREVTAEQAGLTTDGVLGGLTGFLVTGPRWRSLRRVLLGDREGLVEIELAEDLAADLADHPLHPALLDVAAGAMQLLGLPGDGNYLPLAYERLAVHAPLPRRSWSHLRLRPDPAGAPGGTPADLLTADLTLYDETGARLVEAEGFTMRRVSAEAAGQLARSQSVLAMAATAEPLVTPAGERSLQGTGMQRHEGMETFRRLLRHRATIGTAAQIVVSARPLAAALADADAATPERLAAALGSLAAPAVHARPEVSSLYAAPAGDFEPRVAAVWERVLGIERIGVHDNFFELGGTSLSAIQLASELKRDLGVEVATVSVFQAPTVSSLARHLQPDPATAQATFARTLGRAEKKKQALEQARRAAQARR
ncbi:MAG TPA: amino acid adenylation domain-containing protein [Thermoanaerobaculia bacterium]|nr:amino acid adenylation domain-containing protein [Thermoanaerobaculia bacterium]